MRKNIRVVQFVFGIPWLVFGVQHFMFADFVANLVPAYFPVRLFFAYFTGAAMIAAGVSIITNIKASLAAILLGTMLLMFILLIHIPTIAGDSSVINWTRALQDIAIASAAFILVGALSKQETDDGISGTIATISRYAFAILLVAFGLQQFLDLDFLASKVAPYLPLRVFWVYLTGAAMIVTGASVFIGKKTFVASLALGTWMFVLNLLLHTFLLVGSPYNPLYWTAAMLDLAVTCGVFFLAGTSFENHQGLPERPISY